MKINLNLDCEDQNMFPINYGKMSCNLNGVKFDDVIDIVKKHRRLGEIIKDFDITVGDIINEVGYLDVIKEIDNHDEMVEYLISTGKYNIEYIR